MERPFARREAAFHCYNGGAGMKEDMKIATIRHLTAALSLAMPLLALNATTPAAQSSFEEDLAYLRGKWRDARRTEGGR